MPEQRGATDHGKEAKPVWTHMQDEGQYSGIMRLCLAGASILGGWGSRTPRFWAEGVVGGRLGGRGRVVKYYYILLCTGSLFESGDF